MEIGIQKLVRFQCNDQIKTVLPRCKIHKYAGRIHLDYHGENAKGIFQGVAKTLPEKYHTGRFLFINIWRNISDEPVIS